MNPFTVFAFVIMGPVALAILWFAFDSMHIWWWRMDPPLGSRVEWYNPESGATIEGVVAGYTAASGELKIKAWNSQNYIAPISQCRPLEY